MSLPDNSSPRFDFDAVFNVDNYLYFYQEMLTDERSDAEIDFLVKELELDTPLKILDLACGFGRHANRLATLGHELTGIDLTPGFLEIARRDAEARGVAVDYRQGDMRLLNFENAFDRVLLMFTAFGYFEDEQNLQVLAKIQRALKPGGLLFFDLNNRDNLVKRLLPSIVNEKNGDLMIDRSKFDSLTGRLYTQRVIIRDGARKEMAYFVRLYNPTEIRSLLTQAGLEEYKMFGSWNGEPVSLDGPRLIVIGRKPSDQ